MTPVRTEYFGASRSWMMEDRYKLLTDLFTYLPMCLIIVSIKTCKTSALCLELGDGDSFLEVSAMCTVVITRVAL